MKDIHQIAAEAAARATWEVIQAFEKNVPSFFPSFYDVWDDIILREIKAAVVEAIKAHDYYAELGAAESRAAPSFAKAAEGKHASEPEYCKCDEINGDNPACPIHKTWTIETVGMIIGNVPIGDAAEAIAKAHNATHANKK